MFDSKLRPGNPGQRHRGVRPAEQQYAPSGNHPAGIGPSPVARPTQRPAAGSPPTTAGHRRFAMAGKPCRPSCADRDIRRR
jgi:hypothetical protein